MYERLSVIVGPSGSGKTTIAPLVAAQIGAKRVITCTTRFPRPGEVDGVHYRFLHPADFLRRISCGEFAEHAIVHGSHYGTLSQDLDRALISSRDLFVLVLDIQGAETIAQKYPGAQVFFITASLEELMQRLKARDGDDDSEKRIAALAQELLGASSPAVSHVIMNTQGNPGAAAQQICRIILDKVNPTLSQMPRC
jgi:guanylate kinase